MSPLTTSPVASSSTSCSAVSSPYRHVCAPRLHEEKELGNTYTLSTYHSEYAALVFTGPSDFVERSRCLCLNFGITLRGRLDCQCGINSFYILSPEERMVNGIREYFKADTVTHHDDYDISYHSTYDEDLGAFVSWDEAAVESIAQQRTDDFWSNHVERRNVIAPQEVWQVVECGEYRSLGWQEDYSEMAARD